VRRWFDKSVVKLSSSTVYMPLILSDLRLEGVSGIGSVAVKCIDTTRNIDSEGSLLHKD
jgi:hypothetical protein